MALRMARPVRRSGSTNNQFRKRIPSDLLHLVRGRSGSVSLPSAAVGGDEVSVPFTFGTKEVKFSLQTGDASLTRTRHAAATDQIERLFASYRSGPRPILHKERLALAGIAYRDWALSFEDAPGEPAIWQAVLDANARAAATEQGQESWWGQQVDELLARKAIVTDAESRKALIAEVARACNEAAAKLKKNAEGDYRPDETAQRFPGWQEIERASSNQTSITTTEMFERWAKEALAAGRTEKTISEYRSTIRRFTSFVGHDDALRVTQQDVLRWKDKRLSDGLSAKTIHGADLSALKSVFGWAERNALVPSNPAKAVNLRVGKKVKERSQGFTDGEAAALLSSALAYEAGTGELPQTAAAKRWAPWLCAYTGARIGEIVQLRRKDFRRDGPKWVMTITPEAGTVKNKEMREVPLHPHLVELGFPDFIKSRSEGYVFLNAEPGNHEGKLRAVKNRVTSFARAIVVDTRIRPNHAWRHRFVSVCTDEGVHERIINAICGHAPRTVAERYGDVTMRAKWEAIQRLPRVALVAAIEMTDD